MVEISRMGIRNFNVLENQNRVCLFEFIYFLNPKSKFNDKFGQVKQKTKKKISKAKQRVKNKLSKKKSKKKKTRKKKTRKKKEESIVDDITGVFRKF